MADYKLLVPHILKWEGGVANDPDDSGGYTNKGVTIGTWRMYGYDNDHDGDIDYKDLSKITTDQWGMIFKFQYWNRAKGDSIKDQLVANIIIDWLWNSGYYALKNAQLVANTFGAGLLVDGVIGRKSVHSINAIDPNQYSKKLHQVRLEFYRGLAARKPSQKKFLKGWENRANDIVKGAVWNKPGVAATSPIAMASLYVPTANS